MALPPRHSMAAIGLPSVVGLLAPIAVYGVGHCWDRLPSLGKYSMVTKIGIRV